MAFSHDGKRLAVADDQTNAIHLWNVNHPKEQGKPLVGHAAPMTGIAFSSNDRLLAASGEDQMMILWNLHRSQPLSQTVAGFGEKKSVVDAAVNERANLVVWSVEDAGSSSAEVTNVNVASWALNAHELIAGPLRMEFRDSLPGTPIPEATYTRHPISVAPPALSPDGTTAATVVSRGVATDDQDFTITLWDTRAHRLLRTLRGEGEFSSSTGGNVPPLGFLRFSPDSLFLAVGMDDGRIHLWRTKQAGGATEAADPIATIPPAKRPSGAGGSEPQAPGLAFSGDGKILASVTSKGAYYTASFWDVRSQRGIQQLSVPSPATVTSWALSASGDVIALGLDHGSILLIDRRTGQAIGTLALASSDAVTSVAFDRNDQELIAVSSESTITRLDLKTADWVTEGCRLLKPLEQPDWQSFLPGFYNGNPCP